MIDIDKLTLEELVNVHEKLTNRLIDEFTTTFSEDVFNKIFKEITIHGR